LKPKKQYRVHGKFAKRPPSRQLKGRYYKPRTKIRKVSEYSKFQHVVHEYLLENPDVNFRSYGNYSKFVGDIWKEVKGTPIKGIAASIDVIVQDFLSRRKISLVDFRKKYDRCRWWDSDKTMLSIFSENHVIGGDEVVFDGRRYDFPYIKFDIRNRTAWIERTQFLISYLSRVFNHSGLKGEERYTEYVLNRIYEREDGTWYVEFTLILEDTVHEKVKEMLAAFSLTTDEIEMLTGGEELPEEIKPTEKKTETVKESEAERLKAQAELEREKQKTAKEQTELLKAQEKAEKQKEKTLKQKMDAVKELTKFGWTQEEIKKYLGI
jgi:hypothetical protein